MDPLYHYLQSNLPQFHLPSIIADQYLHFQFYLSYIHLLNTKYNPYFLNYAHLDFTNSNCFLQNITMKINITIKTNRWKLIIFAQK